MEEAPRVLRVAAYVVCEDLERRVLVCRIAPGATRSMDGHWTLPGGGIDHGEHPRDAALRELTEETGLEGELLGLLDVDSSATTFSGQDESRPVAFHTIRIIYRARVIGGTLRPEVGGTTDLCRWLSRDELGRVPVVDLVGSALRAVD